MRKRVCAVLAIVGSLLFLPNQSGAEPVHGLSLYGDLKYPKDFTHVDYVNPDAPKGGEVIFPTSGTFDSLNPFVIKGQCAAGIGPLHESLFYATLTAAAYDEPSTRYGYIAESFEVAPDRSSLTFYLRHNAVFHDGSPILADDVVYSFEHMIQSHPMHQGYYKDVKAVEKLNDRTVRFVFSTTQNRELPLILGELPIVSKKFYEKHGFEKADLTVPVGSGPYRIADVKAGHAIVFERIPHWWGEQLPMMKGRYNFNRIRYDYYRDDIIAFESFKAGGGTFRLEMVSKNWAIGYDFPLFKKGIIVKEEAKIQRVQSMDGLIYNTRRDIFQDPLVREALAYAFDFEWMNPNFFYKLFARTRSYFEGSELGATGLPVAAELEILAPYRGRIPERVFTEAYAPPVTDGSGNIRNQLKIAKGLLAKAGYRIQNSKVTNAKTGKPLTFEILIFSKRIERVVQNFVNNLKQLGIDAKIRLADAAQYQQRVEAFDFDMIYGGFAQSLSPGNEQRDFFGAAAADMKGSQNFPGIKDPTIDEVIEKLINAPTREQLITCTKALDRLLQWGFYLIPAFHSSTEKLAYHKKLKHPQQHPTYTIDIWGWWVDPAVKAEIGK